MKALALACALGLAVCAGCATQTDRQTPGTGAGQGTPITRDGQDVLAVKGASSYVVGTQRYAIPRLPLPGRSKSVVEPDFGTPIVRLTDAAVDRYTGPGIQNEYSRADPENADGSRVILRSTAGNWYLYALANGTLTSLDKAFAGCEQEPEPRWDARDPNLFYFVCRTALKSHDVSAGRTRVLRDFGEDVSGAYLVRTRSEGDASRDRRYWALLAQTENEETVAFLVYDKDADQIVGLTRQLDEEPDWVSMDHSGEHVLVGHDSLPYVRVYSRDLKSSIRLPQGSNAHGDLAVTANGRDVWVYQNTRIDYIAMADLEAGTETRLLAIPFGTNTDIGLHVSGNCADTPGWVLISTYGARNPTSGMKHSWMDNQLFMLELAAKPKIWRLAHTRCFTAEHAEDESIYFAEAFAAINRAGTRVHFGSNWGELKTDFTEAYVLPLPDGWEEKLGGE